MKSILNFISILISFILSIFIYFAEVSLLLIFSILAVTSHRTVNNIVQNLEVKKIISEVNPDGELLKFIYLEAEKANINQETIDKFLSSKEVKNMLSQYISSAARYIIIDSEIEIKVKTLVNNSKEEFIKIMNNLTEFNTIEDRRKAESLIGAVSDKLIMYLPEVDTITDNIDRTSLVYLRGIFSPKTIVVLIFIIITLTILIAILRRSVASWSLWLGLTTFFSSLIGLVVATLPLFNFTSLTKNLPLYINTVIESGIKILSSNFFIIGLIYLIMSISLVSLYYLYINKKERIN